MKATKGNHWYSITIFECPLCGRSREYRERRFDAKPKEVGARIEVLARYDWCDQ